MVEGGKAAGKEAAKAAEGIIAKVAKDTLREADDVAKAAGKGATKRVGKDAAKAVEKDELGTAERYSGDLTKVPKPDPHADKLAGRLGGESRVKFGGDPVEREFDAVSDRFVAQAKPGTQQVNKRFREQAKATFEAAKATGRDVYYHFDGAPRAEVRARLEEYAQRYGVHVVIDDRPL